MRLAPVEPAVKIDRAEVFAEIVVADRAHVLRGERVLLVDAEKVAVLLQQGVGVLPWVAKRNHDDRMGENPMQHCDPRDVEVVFRDVARFGRILSAS